jgi:hypothetical protein
MKFTQLVNEKLRLYGEAELPVQSNQPPMQPDAAMPPPVEPEPATPNEIDDLKKDVDSKVSLIVKDSLDMIRDVMSVIKQTFASELNSTKGDVLDDKLQNIIDAASVTDTESATPDKFYEIKSKVRELLPGGEV